MDKVIVDLNLRVALSDVDIERLNGIALCVGLDRDKLLSLAVTQLVYGWLFAGCKWSPDFGASIPA